MGKHSQQESRLIRKSVSNTAVFALAASPLMLLPSTVAASDSCSSLATGVSGATANLLSGGVCELIFTDDVASITLPAEVTKLSAVAVAGGGGGWQGTGPNTGFAGGGGQLSVLEVDSLSSRSFAIDVGSAGVSGDGDTVTSGANTTVDYEGGARIITAIGGFLGQPGDGSYTTSREFVTDGAGSSGANYVSKNVSGAGDFSLPAAGAGTAGDAVYPSGGPGKSLDDLVAGGDLDSSLWATDSALPTSGAALLSFDFGQGGSVASSPSNGVAFSGAGADTNADGTTFGDAASGIVIFRFALDVTPAAPAPYTGPLPVKLDDQVIPCGIATETALTGLRLGGISSAEVDGKAVEIRSAEATKVELTFPALDSGTYTVIYRSNSGNISHQDSLVVGACSTTDAGTPDSTDTPEPETPTIFRDAKRFFNYVGDRGGVIAADEKAIRSYLGQFENLTRITCIGSTSGVPAISSDEALAQARADNACRIVREMFPDAIVSTRTNTGQGVGQFYRAVSIFLVGTK